MSFEELRAAVFALPVDEKLQLVEDLWNSIGSDELPPIPQWQIEELERREAYLKAHPESVRPWEEVYQRLKARYGG